MSTEATPAVQVRIGPLLNAPNAITAVRTVAAVVVGLYAITAGSLVWLAAAYAIYWFGDMADGAVARHLGQETRAGAVLDIVSDRACCALLCVGLVALDPTVALVAAVFLLNFMVLDTMLSLAFLCWPILSPNYFYIVDHRVWALNWSPAAKAVNTAGVVGAVVLGFHEVALMAAIAIALVKVWSAVEVGRRLVRDGLE